MTNQLERRRLELQAEATLTHFRRNYPCPGQIFVIGLSEDSTKIYVLYAFTDREESARNRVLVAKEGGTLSVEFAYTAKDEDAVDRGSPMYNAMMESLNDGLGIYVVSNGEQTEEFLDHGPLDGNFVSNWSYEPDNNFSPRINAFVALNLDNRYWNFGFSIFRKSLFNDKDEYRVYCYEGMEPGFGYGVSTYRPPQRELIPEAYGPENPLTSFYGDPYIFSMKGTPEDIIDSFYQAFYGDNFISLGMKSIDIETGQSETKVINKYMFKLQ